MNRPYCSHLLFLLLATQALPITQIKGRSDSHRTEWRKPNFSLDPKCLHPTVKHGGVRHGLGLYGFIRGSFERIFSIERQLFMPFDLRTTPASLRTPRESLLNLRYSPVKLHEELPDSYLRPQRDPLKRTKGSDSEFWERQMFHGVP
ncbi:hypothetical protein TNIN_119311 [Trichonephila inaurata madagascariensis]|uniref:Uncharacterized protein n=1 Tax=Trichonephila inaurata madagascariensis TaxID=2747483 RepID=A0A8X6XGS5_9ARAC|nr:hypothetical protein TNIN_119311 [Trichonephila inaurata madagascariensis]